jgi:hypothetical protein
MLKQRAIPQATLLIEVESHFPYLLWLERAFCTDGSSSIPDLTRGRSGTCVKYLHDYYPLANMAVWITPLIGVKCLNSAKLLPVRIAGFLVGIRTFPIVRFASQTRRSRLNGQTTALFHRQPTDVDPFSPSNCQFSMLGSRLSANLAAHWKNLQMESAWPLRIEAVTNSPWASSDRR